MKPQPLRSSRRYYLIRGLTGLSLLLGIVTACQQQGALHEKEIIDLTHSFDTETIYWPTEPDFELERVALGMTERGYFYAANRIRTSEHGGTHIDAPIHFYKDRWTVDQIPLERLTGPGVRIDVTEACANDSDYLVSVEDFKTWEREHGPIPDGAIVLVYTGFGARWPDRVRYMGTDERGPEAVPELHFPGLDPRAAEWLATERSIHAVGLDTPSIDHGPSLDFRSHVRLCESNIPSLENVANLDRLPPKGFTVLALPMKIRGGTGGPTRVVAIME